MLFIANKSREIEKNNNNLIANISKINQKIKINKIEFIAHQNSSYIKKLYSLYFQETRNYKIPKIVSIQQLSDEINNIKLVNLNK